MDKPGFAQLQDVIMDADFPDLDLALRRGRHIDRDDTAWYSLLSDAQEQLEAFYRRYGCELIHKTDGYFYLLPTGDKFSRRQLAPGDMLVGQALALLYLDPAVIERGGVITQEDLVTQLSSVLGSDALIAAFNPKRKRFDERILQKNVRNRVAEAARRLATLGFVEAVEDDRVRLRPALLRFAEPVRAASEPGEALAKLVARGEVALVPDDAAAQDDEDAAELDAEQDEAAVAQEATLDAAAGTADADEMPGRKLAARTRGLARSSDDAGHDGRLPSEGGSALPDADELSWDDLQPPPPKHALAANGGEMSLFDVAAEAEAEVEPEGSAWDDIETASELESPGTLAFAESGASNALAEAEAEATEVSAGDLSSDALEPESTRSAAAADGGDEAGDSSRAERAAPPAEPEAQG